jgi:hypothetical protein
VFAALPSFSVLIGAEKIVKEFPADDEEIRKVVEMYFRQMRKVYRKQVVAEGKENSA